MISSAAKKKEMTAGGARDAYNFTFDKSFGQHILKNPKVVE